MLVDPGARAVAYYRVADALRRSTRLRRFARVGAQLILVRMSRVPGVEIRTVHAIGAGLVTFHPHDIVIGQGARIGRRVTLYNGVTLGARSLATDGEVHPTGTRYPTLEDGVIVYSGAKLIGPITIGADSVVAANSVVTRSFPANSVIAGAPARKLDEVG
jgi:serine O-acetyltransferase